ncbi:MAG: hypothetical protein K0Q57_1095 [Gammaproteobacteria bacterium]|nr:hypothetical protein [Gammaproteobacteria bacterium]
MALRQSLSGLATISGSTFKAFEYLISNQKPDLNKIPSDKCDYLAELIEMVRNFPRLILPFSFYPKLNEWLVSLEMLQVEMKAKTVAHTAPYSIAQTFGGSGGAAGGNSSSERVAHEFALNNKG